ncbi:MAG TPA: alkaline phosphatase family protein [Dehalococcoidia bacterium]|nr:alkaline phosphatase family protein [Dehalococcoidia bacterium]
MLRRWGWFVLVLAAMAIALRGGPAHRAEASPNTPLRAAFYYPWFPQAWTQQGISPYTNYHPSLGYYDEADVDTVREQIAGMQYGNVAAGIASWWGQGTQTDTKIPTLLAAAHGSSFQWTIYYEPEGQGDPTVAQLTSDLTYIRDRYASDPNFLHIGGRFVIFSYADTLDGCAMADRWKQANTVNAYVVLKVFPGYRNCASQPDSWHQYGPAVAASSQAGYSYTISPGFNKVGDVSARLPRDLTRWEQSIRDMVASNAPLQLVTTFNEWGEGTAVESASEWGSASGYGAYLDALHANGDPPPCGTTANPPTKYTHVIWIWMENHSYSDVIGNASAPYTTQLAQSCGTATNYASVGSPSLPNYIGATSGSTWGITDDDDPSVHVLTADNLFRQVRSAGLTEKSYEEDMPSNCAQSGSGNYAVRHNPAAYFTGGADRTACQADDIAMGTTSAGNFLNDLNNNTLPNFTFITPNLCNDTHDCPVETGDAWLQSWVPKILASGAYLSGTTAIVIMYDEDTPMPNVIIAPSVPVGTTSNTRFDHYSLLRTTEDMLGINIHLGSAATAASMAGTFHLLPSSPTPSVGGIATVATPPAPGQPGGNAAAIIIPLGAVTAMLIAMPGAWFVWRRRAR